jgi:hypothetical protein
MKKIILILILLVTSFFYLSCKDDAVTVSNKPPNKPYDPHPYDGQQNVNRYLTLSWSCTDPDPGDSLKYDIVASSANNPWQLIVEDYPYTSYEAGLAPDSTVIQWQVTAKDRHNQFAQGPVWTFTTGHRWLSHDKSKY